MEQRPPDKVWTYEDLVTMPANLDHKRYEIFDGELVVTGSPSIRHARVSTRLMTLLLRTLGVRNLAEVFVAPVDVILSPTRVVVPDLLAVASHRKDMIQPHAIVGAPDLVIEILSPSTRKHDCVVKRRLYARSGVREYWIVDLDVDTVEVLSLIEGGLTYRQAGYYSIGDQLHSAVFDLELEVTEIFALPTADDRGD